jgi:hypothetical protein
MAQYGRVLLVDFVKTKKIYKQKLKQNQIQNSKNAVKQSI